MYLDTKGTTMTYDGLPLEVDTFLQTTDMITASTKIITMKAPTVRNHTKVIRYWSITLSYNAAGELIKQSAAVESETRPAWIPEAL